MLSFNKSIAQNKSLLTFGAAYTLGALLQKGIGFIIFLYLAEKLSTSEYAKFGLGYAAFTALGAFASSGIYESLIRQYLEVDENERNRLYRIANTTFVFNACILTVVSLTIVLAFDFSDFGSFLEIIMIMVGGLFSAFFLTQANIFRLREMHQVAIIYLIVPPVLSYIGGLIFVLLFNTSIAFFTGSGIGFVVSLLAFSIFRMKRIGFQFDLKAIKKVLLGSLPFLLIAIVDWLSGYGNSFSINSVFNKQEVAFYVFAYTLASLIQLLASSMNQVWSPRFVALYKDSAETEVSKKYRGFSLAQGAILGFAGAVILLAFFPITDLLNVLQEYNSIQKPLFFLFAGYIACIPLWQAQNYFIVKKAGSVLMKITLVSGFIGLTCWILCMLYIPNSGIYVGFLIYMLIRSGMAYSVARSKWGLDLLWEGTLLGWLLISMALIVI